MSSYPADTFESVYRRENRIPDGAHIVNASFQEWWERKLTQFRSEFDIPRPIPLSSADLRDFGAWVIGGNDG